MYPPDLFKFNIELTDIPNMFYNTAIPVGVDVNADLFSKLSNLEMFLQYDQIVFLIVDDIMQKV